MIQWYLQTLMPMAACRKERGIYTKLDIKVPVLTLNTYNITISIILGCSNPWISLSAGKKDRSVRTTRS